ncbi:nuclear pore complex protein Nup214 isoform X2 [Denticeps clupeoides]|uniref:Nuclear pore complex protein Nup214 n=1 Tax=Denticeps clupeoides TaxID=299321 RepID=A0AAY4AQ98_9TELE|nr:nuclear pore complex protein Nup214 isoform X2 [Denticeps clupeoides]
MSDDPESVPEREMKDFQFRHMKKIRVFATPRDLPKDRSSLLAISNKYGLTFVGLDRTLKVFLTRDIIAAGKREGNPNDIVDGVKGVEVSVEATMHNLALSSDELTLSVCGMSEAAGLVLAFYDVRAFLNKARQQKCPFASLRPGVDPKVSVQDLKWNPVQPTVLALCLSDGSVMIVDVTEDVKVSAQLPATVGVTCVCWSPKGKQVAVGKQDATVVQYTPQLQEKKVIPCPNFYTSDNPVKVLDVLWLSTYNFAVVYAAADGSLETPPELVVVSLPKKDDRRAERYLNFNDMLYGTATERQHHYFLCHIEDWDLVLAASAASIEVGIIAKQEDKTNWELWLLEDASRAELPVTVDSDDTLPLGMAIDYTNQEEVHISDDKKLPPSPTLMLLSTDGVLCPFSLLNTNAGVKQLTNAAMLLPLDGERQPAAALLSAVAPAPPKSSAVTFPPLQMPSTGPTPTATATATTAAVPALLSTGFSFSLPSSTSAVSSAVAPSVFSLAAAAPITSSPFPSSTGFSFTAPASKPPSAEAPASFPFSFSAPSITKPPATNPVGPAPVQVLQSVPPPARSPVPQRQPAVTPLAVLKEPATPSIRMNLNDRFSVMETPGAPPSAPQPFSFASTPKLSVIEPSSQPAPLTIGSKPATVPAVPVRPMQPTIGPAGPQKIAMQPPASTPVPQAAALTMKAMEKQLQQKKDSDPMIASFLEETGHFQKELDYLKACSEKADFRVGSNEEMKELRKECEDLHVFILEIKETTESLHGDTSTLKTTLLEGFAGAEDAKTQSELIKNKSYLQLLYKKPLDPRREEQLKEIRRLYQYVKFTAEDVNDVLDREWEKHLENRKKQKHMIIPQRETLFTTLANNLDIINQQKQKLDHLERDLQSLRLYNKTSTWSRTCSTTSEQGLDNELESLKDALLKASLDPSPKAPSKSPGKMTPAKQSKLRNFLSKRQMPPVRSTAPANLSRSSFLSPKYYEDLDDVSSTSSLSQALEMEECALLEEEEPVPLPVLVPAVSRHHAVVRTSSVQPGFMQSTPFAKMNPGLGSLISPVPTNKVHLTGADSTALATKTVKHGAPPTEKTTPVTIPAQQAAATAALRRQMASQKPMGASLTESTLKTVPQVVNVQELKDKGPAIPVSTVISSSVPAPAVQVVQQVLATVATTQAKRNSVQGALKVAALPTETTPAPQTSFVFGASSIADIPVSSAASAPSLTDQGSQPFSFIGPAGSFSFTAPNASSAAQGPGVLQVKDPGQLGKFSFGTNNSSKIFGAATEETSFSFAKSSSPALGASTNSTPSPILNVPAEPAKITSSTPALGTQDTQPPKTLPTAGGDTLGNFSCLRVGQSEEDPKTTKGFTFGQSSGVLAQFSFSSVQTNKPPAEAGVSGGQETPFLPQTSASDPAASSSVVKPPEVPAQPTFSFGPPSFSSVLAAPLPSTETNPPEPSPECRPAVEPEAQSPEPQSQSPPLSVEDTSAATASTASIAANAVNISEKPPTPLSPNPVVTPAPPPSSVTQHSEGVPTSDPAASQPPPVASLAPVPAASAFTTPATQEAAAVAPPSDTPGSIFTQPSTTITTTETTTLGVTTLTPVITTAAPATAATATPVPAITAATTPVFGQPSNPPTSTPAPTTGFGSSFGASTAAPAPTGFGKPVFGQVGNFGQPASGSSAGFTFGQSVFGSAPAPVFGQPAAPNPSSSAGGTFFGSGSTSSANTFSFSQLSSTSSTSSTPSTGGGLFSSGTPAFGQQSSGFGQGSVFGANTATTSSTGFSFGQPSAFGSTSTSSVFGQQPSSSVFGQASSSSGGLFGSGSANQAAVSGGGFFSGLGGKPSEEAANKNPFASTNTGGFGQANQTGAPSLFGNSGAKTFGFGASSFGEQKPGGTFTSGGNSVASQGFGSFSTPAKTGGFGSAPVFGSPPAFGGSPAFGSGAGFSSSPSFSGPVGSSAGKVFGEGTAASNMGGFGFASPQSAPSFGSMAAQSAPSFGNLAQQGSGFGPQTSGFGPGFGSSGGFTGGFGNTNAANQSFGGWRS